jgi:hypothetical protein
MSEPHEGASLLTAPYVPKPAAAPRVEYDELIEGDRSVGYWDYTVYISICNRARLHEPITASVLGHELRLDLSEIHDAVKHLAEKGYLPADVLG